MASWWRSIRLPSGHSSASSSSAILKIQSYAVVPGRSEVASPEPITTGRGFSIADRHLGGGVQNDGTGRVGTRVRSVFGIDLLRYFLTVAKSSYDRISLDSPQRPGIMFPPPHVDLDAMRNHFRRLPVERADDAGRRADDETVVWEGLALGNDGAGADDRIGADPCPVEKD